MEGRRRYSAADPVQRRAHSHSGAKAARSRARAGRSGSHRILRTRQRKTSRAMPPARRCSSRAPRKPRGHPAGRPRGGGCESCYTTRSATALRRTSTARAPATTGRVWPGGRGDSSRSSMTAQSWITRLYQRRRRRKRNDRNVLIEDGTLRGYLPDEVSARPFGVTPSGSGRRRRSRTTSCAHDEYVHVPGQSTSERHHRNVDRGIYAVSYSGGQVNISNGDFVSRSPSVPHRDGKVTAPCATDAHRNGRMCFRR